jgi:hypothetical protein
MRVSTLEIALFLITGLLVMLVVIGLPIILGSRYVRRDRELEHTERMRALELGQILPKDEPWWTPTKLCASIGLGVPIVIFVLAIVASNANGSARDEWIWTAAGLIGVAGVVSGAIMAIQLPISQERSRSESNPKPMEEVDALDVVSRRG